MTMTEFIIDHLAKKANRNYLYTLKNLVPLVPRDAMDFETLLERAKSKEPQTFEGATIQALLLRLFPDKVPLHYALFLREYGMIEVEGLANLIVSSRRRSDFIEICNLVGHSQIELKQPV